MILPEASNEVLLLQDKSSGSEFAQRLASKYNPRYSKPNSTSDQRAADLF